MRAVHRLQIIPSAQKSDLGFQFLDVVADLLLGVSAGVGRDGLAHAFGELDEVGTAFRERIALLPFVLLEHFYRGEHGLGVVREMAGGFVHLLLGQMGRFDAHVAGLEFGFLGQPFQFLHQHGPFR